MFLQFRSLVGKNAGFIVLVGLLACTVNAQQANTGTIRGKVADANGALVVGANVTIVGADGKQRTTQTNQEGFYSINNLIAGKYTVRVAANGFALYENAEADVAAGKTLTLDVALSIIVNEQVTVGGEQVINTDPEANASAIVLKSEDIKALPDNRTDLEAALQALAGPGAGPNGGEIFIDGFSGGATSAARFDSGNSSQSKSFFIRIRPFRFGAHRDFNQAGNGQMARRNRQRI